MKFEAWNLDDLNPNSDCLTALLLVTPKRRDGIRATQQAICMTCLTSTGVGVWTARDGLRTGKVGNWVHLGLTSGPPMDLSPWNPSTESFLKQTEEQKQPHFTFLPSHLQLMWESEY